MHSAPHGLRALAAAITLACLQSAQAQEPPAQPPVPPPATDGPTKPATPAATTRPPAARPAAKPPTPETIEVTGARSGNEERRQSTAAKIIITREDIEQYGDTNIGEVMRRLPGVSQGGRPGRGGPVRMRGMGGGFTQILIDGERIAPGFSLEQLSPEQVERIEILRAPTAETGARAIAGTINIILREPIRKTNNEIRGGVEFERGRESPNLSVSRNDTLGPTGTYNLTLSLGKNDQLTDTDSRTTYVDTLTGATDLDQRTVSQSAEERERLFLTSRLQWRIGPAEQFSIQPFIARNESQSRSTGTLTQFAGSDPAQYATSTGATDSKVAVNRFNTMLMKRLGDDTRMELRGSVGTLDVRTNSATNQFSASGANTLRQTSDVDIEDKSWNVAGKLTHNLGKTVSHALTAGWELEGVKRTENSVTLLNGTPQLADFGESLDVTTRRTALFIQDEWDPAPQFSANAGLRWESIETKSDAADAQVRNKSTVLTPLAHVVWRFADPKRDQVRLSLTQSYRAPTTQNLVSRPSLNTLFPVPGPNTSASPDRAGNPGLKPERANGIDLAYESYLKSGGIISVNLFTRRIKDLIRNVTRIEDVTWATSDRFVSRPQNLGKARTSGIEFDAKFQLQELIDGAKPVSIRANVSLYDSSVESVPGPNNRIDQQPKVSANLGADYRFAGTQWRIGGNLAWTPAYDTQLTEDQFQKLSTRRVIDAFALWYINADTRVRFSLANINPRDSVSTNGIFQGSQLQTVVSNGRTDLSGAIRLEMKL